MCRGQHKEKTHLNAPVEKSDVQTRSRETRVFVFLTVVLAPMIAVAIVGAYGLIIWVYQMLAGPPTG